MIIRSPQGTEAGRVPGNHGQGLFSALYSSPSHMPTVSLIGVSTLPGLM